MISFRHMNSRPSQPLRVLVAGTGSIGRRHVDSIRNIVPEARFELLRRSDAEDEFARSIGATISTDLGAALSSRPDAAIIATPSAHHADLAVACLQAGIPMYIEKPVVTDRAQWQAVSAAARAAADLPVLCGCNLRFLPSLARARQLIREGAIGRVVRVSMQVGQWLPDWRPGGDFRTSYSASRAQGGGVVFDLVHELDAALWIFGEFERMQALGGHFSSLDIETEDAAVIVLARREGPVVSIGLDYVAREPVRRYEFIGERGTLIWDLRARRLEIIGGDTTPVAAAPPADFDVSLTYRSAMREFLDAISAARLTSQPLDEGLRAAELALRINEAIRA
jgi:predicted dehydrogenase